VHYFVLVPVGCGKEIEIDAMLDADDTEEVLREIRALSAELPIQIRPTCAPQYVRFAEGGRYGGCLAGTGMFFISSQGDVFPCGYLPVQAGCLLTQPVADVWQGSPVFRDLRRNDLKGACGRCYFKGKCRGCRARAYGMTGDYLAADTTCALAGKAVPV
jgi:radical SAM protein with 4Fe4S-binding SPASM domain